MRTSDSMSHHRLSEEALERLYAFMGYGNPDGRFWFIGMEEGGGSWPELYARAERLQRIADLGHAQAESDGPGLDRHVPTWAVMIRIILRLHGRDDWAEKESVRKYQKEKLGRHHGETFLTELMPLPVPSTKDWLYPELFPTRLEYYGALRPYRIDLLRREFDEHSPQYVFCYGKGNWRHYESIFSDVEFVDGCLGKIRWAQIGQTSITLTPFLAYELMTREVIEDVAKLFDAP